MIGSAGMERRAVIAIAALAVVALVTVGSTWRVFSQVADEPAHVAAGMEWIVQREYTQEPQHPPLARIFFAAGPALRGAPYVEEGWLVEQGNAILHHDDRYSSMLAAARAGNVPFLLLMIAAVAIWTRRLFGSGAAAIAVLLVVTMPPLLAHAGLATTDLAVAAALVAALASFDAWLERPSPANSALLGTTVAIAILTKFSTVVFLPVGLIAVAIFSEGRREAAREKEVFVISRAGGVALAAAIAAALVWALYGFSTGPLFPPGKIAIYDQYAPSGALHEFIHRTSTWRVPAPELVQGIVEVALHDRHGHPSYLLGEVRMHGWWYYFPVVLLVKTPIPFLLLVLASLIVLARNRSRRGLAPLVAALGMLGVAMTSSINLGVRHILPLYPLLAIAAAGAAVTLWRRRRWMRVAVAAAIAWQVAGTAAAHPDHLAWFNAIAAGRPEAWLADSNLDWGQDLLRLSRETRKRKIGTLRLAYFGSAEPERHELPRLLPARDEEPATGWIAVSRMRKLGITSFKEPAFRWLDAYEPIEVGKSILLYYVPPEDHPEWACEQRLPTA